MNWLIGRLKRYWKWLVPTVLVVLALMIVPMLINQEKEAIASARETFNQKPLKERDVSEAISLFLPQGYQIESEDANNFVIRRGAEKYLLFVNPVEKATSKMMYYNLEQGEKGYVINEAFEKSDRFGYIFATKVEKDYSLIVGVGGAKISTVSTRSDLARNAEEMMRIVNSVTINSEVEVPSVEESVAE